MKTTASILPKQQQQQQQQNRRRRRCRDRRELLLSILDKHRNGELPLFLCLGINKAVNYSMGSENFLKQIQKEQQVRVRAKAKDLGDLVIDCNANNKLVVDASGLPVAPTGLIAPPAQLSMRGQLFRSILETQRDSGLSSFFSKETNEAIHNETRDVLDFIEKGAEYLVFDIYDEKKETSGLYMDWFDGDKVEATIRLFPQVLSKKWGRAYPIAWLSYNNRNFSHGLKSISLVPLYAKLATELNIFDEKGDNDNCDYGNGNGNGNDNTRGGLLTQDPNRNGNVLQTLCMFSGSSYCSSSPSPSSRETQLFADEAVLRVMKALKDDNLLKKEDIREYNLLERLFPPYGSDTYFPEKRFRFLSDWNPAVLATISTSKAAALALVGDENYYPQQQEQQYRLAIHFSIWYTDIRAFLIIFEAGMRHYPFKLGFVFARKGNVKCDDDGADDEHEHEHENETPLLDIYQEACKKYGKNRVTSEVLERVLVFLNSNDTTRRRRRERILLSLAADERMHLNGLYLVLRNDPTVVLRRRQVAGEDHTTTRSSNSKSCCSSISSHGKRNPEKRSQSTDNKRGKIYKGDGAINVLLASKPPTSNSGSSSNIRNHPEAQRMER